MIDDETLKMRQSFPLELKVAWTKARISEFYQGLNGNVYVSFSGGKDSTVLLDLVRSVYPDVVAVFSDTGLEYPEIRDFVKTIDNVIWLKPKYDFKTIIDKYGLPLISKETSQKLSEIKSTNSKRLYDKRMYGDKNGNGKISERWKYLLDCNFKISHKCCYHLKKAPFAKFEKQSGLMPITGVMAYESKLRRTAYKMTGCNSFDGRIQSKPLSIWLEDDIWDYIRINKLPYSSIYDMGYERTGCMFCMFGVHLEKRPNRFDKMKITHPRQYEYCMNKLGLRNVLKHIGIEMG